MIVDAAQASPSVAPIWEARREDFDPCLASHDPFSSDEVEPRLSIRDDSSDARAFPSASFLCPFSTFTLSHGRFMLVPLFQGSINLRMSHIMAEKRQPLNLSRVLVLGQGHGWLVGHT